MRKGNSFIFYSSIIYLVLSILRSKYEDLQGKVFFNCLPSSRISSCARTVNTVMCLPVGAALHVALGKAIDSGLISYFYSVLWLAGSGCFVQRFPPGNTCKRVLCHVHLNSQKIAFKTETDSNHSKSKLFITVYFGEQINLFSTNKLLVK